MESLIAIIILGILMAGGLAFYYQANALYYHSLHAQLATWAADSEMEQIKSNGCALTNPDTGSSVPIGNLTGTLVITWPTPATPDPCQATTVKGTCSSSTTVGVCVTWTEPGFTTTQSVGLATYVGS